MAKGTGLLFSMSATGALHKTLVYSSRGVRKLIKCDRLLKNFGLPLIFFEDALFGQLYSMHSDHPWFCFFSFATFFTYFTKKPYTSNTPAQQNIRAEFKAGRIAWGLLTEEEKQVYRDREGSQALTGYNIFMSEYIKENYTP